MSGHEDTSCAGRGANTPAVDNKKARTTQLRVVRARSGTLFGLVDMSNGRNATLLGSSLSRRRNGEPRGALTLPLEPQRHLIRDHHRIRPCQVFHLASLEAGRTVSREIQISRGFRLRTPQLRTHGHHSPYRDERQALCYSPASSISDDTSVFKSRLTEEVPHGHI
jgi:hypothetical protein